MDLNDVTGRNFRAPDALRLEHDDIRAGLARGVMEHGPIATAAKRLARLCLPHFEQEEQLLFPIFELLHQVAAGDIVPEMASVLRLISQFSARHARLHQQHQSIFSAAGALLTTAHRENNREMAQVARQVWMHERMEDMVLHPTAILIGHYVRERLHLGPRTQRTFANPREAAPKIAESAAIH